MPSSRTPSGARKKAPSSKARKKSSSAPDAICTSMDHAPLKIDSASWHLLGAVPVRPLARPMLPTHWEQWDEEICDVVGFAKIVMSLDPTTKLDNLELSWIDKRHFKI